MKRYVDKSPLRHTTQRSPRDRRAVAWQIMSFRAKSREALTKTRIGPITEGEWRHTVLAAGLGVALLAGASSTGLAANTISPTTVRVSVTSSGAEGNGSSGSGGIGSVGFFSKAAISA